MRGDEAVDRALMNSVAGFWDSSWRPDVLECALGSPDTIALVHQDGALVTDVSGAGFPNHRNLLRRPNPVGRASDVGREPGLERAHVHHIVVVGQEPFERVHVGFLICASACSSQYVIPISRYIAAAVVRCPCAFAWSPTRR